MLTTSMYMASKLRLPAELSDRIVDYLHDDLKALSTCSLVCRAWLPAARYHRWSYTRVERSRILSFISLLVDTPDLSSYVSRLGLYNLSGPWHRRMKKMMVVCDPDKLELVLNALPNLRSLELEGWLIVDEVVQVAASNPTFRALRDLALIECDIDMLDTAARLTTMPFSAFTSESPRTLLESITLRDIQILEADDWSPPVDLKPVARKLSLSRPLDSHAQELFLWMLHSITSLQLVILDWRDAVLAGYMLCSVGDTLREVDLIIDTMSSLQAAFNESNLSLSGLNGLQRCSLTFNLREMFVPGNISLPWISALLAQPDSTSLEEIGLRIKADNLEDLRALDSECAVREIHPVQFDDLEALDWHNLEQSITMGRLPSLKRIVIQGAGDSLRFLSFMHVKHRTLRPMLQLQRVKR